MKERNTKFIKITGRAIALPIRQIIVSLHLANNFWGLPEIKLFNLENEDDE
ncbi:hypothetical protein [Anabaena sp. CCY 9910]|uniref:hypothetical protein n=1 Tax=Anabaena sp. CCY 9910 TaxID=3103870 RepID=UPI0039DFF7C5